jgi:DNA-binding phage protein
MKGNSVPLLSISLMGSSSAASQQLIDHIIAFAKRRSVDQATLAARAGISPESLSRLKKAGSCRLATALDLARATGLKTLEMRDQSPGKVAASLAAGKLSAGRRRPISSEDLLQALQTGEFPAEFRGHLCGFFEELPIELVHDVILDENLSYSLLVLLARELGVEGETIDWLTEMAGDGLADAA